MRSSWTQSSYGGGWGYGMPPLPAVKILLIVNIAVFCIEAVLSKFLGIYFIGNTFALHSLAYAQEADGILRYSYIWQFFTYMFLHADVWHIFFNLLMFYFFGNEVEAQIGSKRLLQIYFLGGIVGGLLWFVFNLHSPFPLVGASAAIYAVMIAFATLDPGRPITLLLFFILPVTLLAKYWAFVAIGLSILLVLGSPNTGGVAHLAHLGGMAMGYLYIKGMMENTWLKTLPSFKRKAYPKPTHLRVLKTPSQAGRYVQEKIDPILDKIARDGIQSLTPEERRILEEAKDRLP